MFKIREIHEFHEIWEIISEQAYDARVNRYRSSCLYRGCQMPIFIWQQVLPEIVRIRERFWKSQYCVILQNMLLLKILGLENSKWRQLIIGQHHGLPTRLLDWTYSPLAALHFATSGEEFSRMEKNDCVVWAIDIEEINRLLPDKYIKELQKENSYLFTVKMLEQVVQELDQYDDDMREEAMVLLEPPSIDQRIINQYSYFSIIPKDMTDIEAFLETKTENTVKYVIDKLLKWRIRDMLDQLNINERIVYPGLDGLSSWIKGIIM